MVREQAEVQSEQAEVQTEVYIGLALCRSECLSQRGMYFILKSI